MHLYNIYIIVIMIATITVGVCLEAACWRSSYQKSEILTFDRERSFDQAGERVEGASEARCLLGISGEWPRYHEVTKGKPWKNHGITQENHPQMIFEWWFPGVSRKKSSVMADSYRVSNGDLPLDGTYEEISIETNLDFCGK